MLPGQNGPESLRPAVLSVRYASNVSSVLSVYKQGLGDIPYDRRQPGGPVGGTTTAGAGRAGRRCDRAVCSAADQHSKAVEAADLTPLAATGYGQARPDRNVITPYPPVSRDAPEYADTRPDYAGICRNRVVPGCHA